MDYPVSKIVLQTVHKLWCLSTNMRNLPCDPPQSPAWSKDADSMAFWQKTPVTWAAVFTFVRAAAPKQTAHGGRATRTKRATRQESRGHVADRLEGFSHVGRDDVTSRYIAAVTKHDWAEDMIRFYNGCVTDDTHKNNVPKNYTQGNNRIQMLGWQWQATWKIRADPNLPRVNWVNCWGGQMRRETNTKEVDTTSAPTATVALLTQLLLLPALHHDPRPAASSFQ